LRETGYVSAFDIYGQTVEDLTVCGQSK